MTKSQVIGITIIILGIVTGYFFEESNLISTISGVISAIGLMLILKWFPLKKQKSVN
ncbi:hypothetical protein [Polaribacter staleyi]|uniref:hypothetical protein n=1 Tax=Polaribacter staleyi TaxID=2022337 RepID=UPI0031B9E4EE